MSVQLDQDAEPKFVVTNTIIVADIQRSLAFYRDVLGATVLREGEPTFLRFGNVWLTINRGGGPTDDKPEVFASPPRDPNLLSLFLNLRVTDIRRAGRNLSLNRKSMPRNYGATCVIRMATSSKWDKRP